MARESGEGARSMGGVLYRGAGIERDGEGDRPHVAGARRHARHEGRVGVLRRDDAAAPAKRAAQRGGAAVGGGADAADAFAAVVDESAADE